MAKERNESTGAPVQTGLRSYTPTQLFFLTRLTWLVRQRRETINTLDPNSWQSKLLNKALYSTYMDCVQEGVGDEAKRLLAQQNQNTN